MDMNYKIGYIKDVLGNNYIGIKFNKNQINPYLKKMEDIVDDKELYNTLINNQQRRDSNGDYSYHCTILSVMEYNKLHNEIGAELQERLEFILSLDISDLEFKGVGSASNRDNQTFFVVLSSPILDEIRLSLGLEPRDFHITIGFDKKDVFGVRKNQVLPKINKIKKIYDNYMEEFGSYKWLYSIKNFDMNLKNVPNDKIKLDNVSDTTLSVIIDHTMIQIGLIEGELQVVTQSEIKK